MGSFGFELKDRGSWCPVSQCLLGWIIRWFRDVVVRSEWVGDGEVVEWLVVERLVVVCAVEYSLSSGRGLVSGGGLNGTNG